uniref:glutaminyl-peptide cyclotransferase n=1 Tax=Timema californicum TaxID=61474 RepID=A0A7R9PBP2_TIMCA|nr:unnamed protein product [Timema californicum]
MFRLTFVCVILISCSFQSKTAKTLRDAFKRHQPRSLNADQILKLSALSNVTQFQSVLNTVIQPRVVGTEGHEQVKQYLMNYMNGLGWTVETDVFKDSTPIFGTLQFTNVIAKLNPNAQRFLTLACHYDSKYVREYTFNGATDSAVPCSMMLNMAYVMRNVFNSAKNKEVYLSSERVVIVIVIMPLSFHHSSPLTCTHSVICSSHLDLTLSLSHTPLEHLPLLSFLLNHAPERALYLVERVDKCYNLDVWIMLLSRRVNGFQSNISLQFIFFDGEEAFKEWSDTDSLYGARHLAQLWGNEPYSRGTQDRTTQLDRIDVLVLLDLLGAPDPSFFSFFPDTSSWYRVLINAEQNLSSRGQLERYSSGRPQQSYFKKRSMYAGIEDDHVPFMKRDVPVLHLIPYPFPSVWHKQSDNLNAIDFTTCENLNKIFRVFVAEYLHLRV